MTALILAGVPIIILSIWGVILGAEPMEEE